MKNENIAFLEELSIDRRQYLDALEANSGDINLDIFEDFYPDEAHFVYELLQNAEDAMATEVSFILTQKECIIEHNGTKRFSKEDVRAITGIHNSTKKTKPDQIGRWGVGFKSVFIYTANPKVISKDFSFQISELVYPTPIAYDSSIGNRTRFHLPFDSNNRTPEKAFLEIKNALESLPAITALFLSNIRAIQWKIDEVGGELRRIVHKHSEFHVKIQKRTSAGEDPTFIHFLLFKERASGMSQDIGIAYPLQFKGKSLVYENSIALSDQLEIDPEQDGQVCIYFPAEKEMSGLRFHVNAPFIPELSRASVKESPANTVLYQQLAVLSASSLHHIKELGLLSTAFLGVLPNSKNSDRCRSHYEPIRDAILTEMNEKPLVPTEGGSHAPGKLMLLVENSLRRLLEPKDVDFLDGWQGSSRSYVKNAKKGTMQEKFISSLAIKSWSYTDLVDSLGGESTVDENGLNCWLKTKSAQWCQLLYSLFERECDRKSWFEESIEHPPLPIVRTSDGTFCLGNGKYFPVENAEIKPDTGDMVDPGVIVVFDNEKGSLLQKDDATRQKDDAKRFLRRLGVQEYGEKDRVKSILDERYSKSSGERDMKQYEDDFKQFIAFSKITQDVKAIFSKYYLFIDCDGIWRKAKEMFIDEPYPKTMLHAYYKVLREKEREGKPIPTRSSLSDCYRDLFEDHLDLEYFVEFSEKVGVQASLSVKQLRCAGHPKEDLLKSIKGNKVEKTEIDEDYFIDWLFYIIEEKDVAISRLIWDTMCRDSAGKLHARYSPNRGKKPNSEKSRLVYVLAEKPWIPQEAGNGFVFVLPCDAKKEALPEDFQFCGETQWIEEIDFGKNEQLQSDASQRKEKQAQEVFQNMGFCGWEIKDFKKLADSGLSADDVLAFGQQSCKPELPKGGPRNPEFRKKRLAKQAENSPARITEERLRSVRVGNDRIKEEAKEYLRGLYTNPAGVMICQICGNEMPFRLPDGQYFFEAVQILGSGELGALYRENYLALCPNDGARFRHANATEGSLSDQLLELDAEDLNAEDSKIALMLGGEEETAWFNETHLRDLQTVIESWSANKKDREIEDADDLVGQLR
jgi:hypothetical protein